MPKSGTSGSVRGARGNSRPYRDRAHACQIGQGLDADRLGMVFLDPGCCPLDPGCPAARRRDLAQDRRLRSTKQPKEDLALDEGSEETYVGRAIQQAQETKQGIKEVRPERTLRQPCSERLGWRGSVHFEDERRQD